MNTEAKQILEAVRDGHISVDDALLKLKAEPFDDLGFAKPDHHRALRQGAAEVIFGAGKTPEQIAGIVRAMQERGQERVLITRLSEDSAMHLNALIDMKYDAVSRLAYTGTVPSPSGIGRIVAATGGTSDIPVAEEAAQTAEFFGNEVTRLYDVGVAIAIAGMEGALASVIGGLADCPVIAVPTSIGYGASFGGLSALLSMLNSCASGVCTVNIDNGFGAGYLAGMINHMEAKP